METTRKDSEVGRAQLGLWDATSIIVGIIIGVGIFVTPQEVFSAAPGPVEGMMVWVVGGVLALVGALCFAELASTYPHSGGEYVYLTKAYGPLVGYLYGWAQIAVIRPASICAVAYIFAIHAQVFVPGSVLLLAASAVVVLSAINIFGATLGANTQNLLTAAKILGLAGIVGFGLFASDLRIPAATEHVPAGFWFNAALIPVLWTYGGWHEAAYVAAEVKDSRRNLPLSLILGTLTVTVIYLLVNGAVLLALGFDGARVLEPKDVVQGTLGKWVDLMIVVSALGAMNGMIFTTARIGSAFGQDHRLFKPLNRWSRRGTPIRSLVIQGFVNLAYLLGASLASKDFSPQAAVSAIGLAGSPMALGPIMAAAELYAVDYRPGGLQSLDYWIKLTMGVFYFFFFLTGVALFILRVKDPHTPRPFRVPLYPVLPMIFCASCAYLVGASLYEARNESLLGMVVLVAGVPFYFLPKKRKKATVTEEITRLAATR